MIDIKKQALMEAVSELHDPKFKVPNGFLIPLRNQLYVKKETGYTDIITKTEGGIILPETAASNTIIPDVGTVYVVGDEVSDFLFPGLRVCYNGEIQYMEVMINGVMYMRMYEHEILGILPHKTYVYQGVRSAAYLDRVSRMKRAADFVPKKAAKDQNDLDKQEEIAKKIIKKK